MCRVQDVSGEFLLHLKSIGQSPRTIEIRRFSIGKFLLFLAASGKTFSDADYRKVEEYRASLADAGLSEASVDMHMRSLRKFFGFLEERNLVFDNPFRKIVMHKPKFRNMGTISESDMRKLITATSRIKWSAFRNRAMFETLYATGMRKGEFTSLKIHDVDLSRNIVRVFGKGKKERMLPLGKHAAEYIGLYLRHTRPELAARGGGDCDSLWLSCHGKKLDANALTVLLRFSATKAGIASPVSCHALRRTCATHMLRNGAHPAVIAQLLGHSCLKTLSHYLRISITDLKKEHSRSRPGQ